MNFPFEFWLIYLAVPVVFGSPLSLFYLATHRLSSFFERKKWFHRVILWVYCLFLVGVVLASFVGGFLVLEHNLSQLDLVVSKETRSNLVYGHLAIWSVSFVVASFLCYRRYVRSH